MVFLLGLFWKRMNSAGATWGLAGLIQLLVGGMYLYFSFWLK